MENRQLYLGRSHDEYNRALRNCGKFLMILIITAGGFSCSDHTKEVPERKFYFETRTFKNNEFCKDLAVFLNTRIPQQKYAITNRSGVSWPYYEILELDETISRDSLMTPHWYLHKMIFKDSNSTLKRDDHLVRIDVMPYSDTIPNYRVEVYEMDSIGLTLSANSGIHFIDTTKFSSRPLWYEYYLQSIIRYSFK